MINVLTPVVSVVVFGVFYLLVPHVVDWFEMCRVEQKKRRFYSKQLVELQNQLDDAHLDLLQKLSNDSRENHQGE